MHGVGGGAGMGRPWREEGAETQKPRLVTEAVQTGPAGHGFHGGRGRREGGMTREDWTLPMSQDALPTSRPSQPLWPFSRLPAGKALRPNSDYSPV